jgi:hypothetical protein
MKIFLPTSFALCALGVMFYIAKGGQLWRLVPYIVIIGFVVLLFIIGYNTYVPGAEQTPIESFILDTDTLSGYTLALHRSSAHSGVYVMGRNLAIRYGWHTITKDPLTFMVGLGLGARGESVTLGTAGVAFAQAYRQLSLRSSLLILMQEMGFSGLIAMTTFIIWISLVLFRDIRRDTESPITELRYALLLFSLLWPIWMWYTTVLNHGVTMLLYWGTLGYVLGEAKRNPNYGIRSSTIE